MLQFAANLAGAGRLTDREEEAKLKRELNPQVVKSLKAPGPGYLEVWDSTFDVPHASFGVRVSPTTQKKSWIMLCRRERITIGKFPAISLSKAREKAHNEAARILATGADPAGERRKARTAPLFKDVAERFLKQHVATLRPQTQREYRRIIKGELVEQWGEQRIHEVDRAAVLALLDEIAVEREAPYMSNKVRAVASILFSWALSRDLIEVDPTASLPRRRRERSRDRVLSDTEIKRLWTALEKEKPVTAALFKILTLCGQRSGETAGARWAEIDLDAGVWIIPGERTKNRRAHKVPLSEQARSVLSELSSFRARAKKTRARRPALASEFLFPSPRGGPVKWLSHAGARIAKKAKIEDFRPHDLRRTAASGMAGLGVRRTTLQKILNHADSSSVTAIYDRASRWGEQVEAMRLWGQHVEKIVTQEPETATTTLAAGGAK